MRGALGETGAEETSHVPHGHRAVPHAARRSLDLDQGLKPEQPARSIAHDLSIDTALAQARLDRSRYLVGTDRTRSTVTRHVDANHARTSCARATASRMRSTSQRPSRRPSTMAAGPSAQSPRQ